MFSFYHLNSKTFVFEIYRTHRQWDASSVCEAHTDILSSNVSHVWFHHGWMFNSCVTQYICMHVLYRSIECSIIYTKVGEQKQKLFSSFSLKVKSWMFRNLCFLFNIKLWSWSWSLVCRTVYNQFVYCATTITTTRRYVRLFTTIISFLLHWIGLGQFKILNWGLSNKKNRTTIYRSITGHIRGIKLSWPRTFDWQWQTTIKVCIVNMIDRCFTMGH